MKKNLRLLGLSALALAGSLATTGGFNSPNQNVTVEAGRTIGKTNQSPAENQNQNQRISQESRDSMQIRNEYRKSFASSTFSNSGIPPKIYGMHFVKRGTHKRTNI